MLDLLTSLLLLFIYDVRYRGIIYLSITEQNKKKKVWLSDSLYNSC